MRTQHILILVCALSAQAGAQTVLFDFENAQVGNSLPINLTVAGISASFSSSGLGGFYVQQPQNTILVTPVGFSGNCLVPSSIYGADLQIGFSQTLTDFSILYAPQELACDSSATMRVTAYREGTLVGTATTNAVAGTWPSETLRFSSTQGFNSVVIHYDKAPVTGGDYGTIFVADNMRVTAAPPPIILTTATKLANGAFQFTFTNTPNALFSVFGSANPALPFSNWTPLLGLTEAPPGQFQFIDSQATNTPCRFYRISSP